MVRRTSLRHWKMAPGQNALLAILLALGVAAFIAVRLANRAAITGFEGFAATLSGPSDWVIEAPTGLLPESVLAETRRELGARPVEIAPVVETTATLAEPDAGAAANYRLLGIDVIGVVNFTEGNRAAALFAAGSRRGSDLAGPWISLGRADEVWVPAALANRRTLRILVDDRMLEVRVAGAIPPAAGNSELSARVILMDLPRLQALTGRTRRLDRVEFVVAPGPEADRRRSELGELLTKWGGNGERWTVRTPGARRETARTMTEAFRLNLTILSLLALLVGLYLIFQALDGAVVRRRVEIAILRSLGVTERMIRSVWIFESAVLGLVGGALGLLMGWLGAVAAVGAVATTINALYFATQARSPAPQPEEVAFALGLGVAAGIVAGWWPAREAAHTPPAQILVRSGGPAEGPALWRTPWAGALVVAAGAFLARLPPYHLADGVRFPVAGYGAALAWIIGGGILWAAALPAGARLAAAAGAGRRRAEARVALSHLLHPSGRHRIASAALLCAVGMAAGMAILVASFERTVTGWVGRTLRADLYITSEGSVSASSENRIHSATLAQIASDPGVAEADALSVYPLTLDGGGPTQLTGADLERTRAHSDLAWAEPPADDAVFDPRRNAGLALVSESFSERFGKHRDDALALATPSGRHSVRIAGVFADYGNERGSILVERRRLAEWMGDDSVTHVSLIMPAGVPPELVQGRLNRRFPALRIRTHGSLRDEILRVFRQTFGITYALEVIGVVVAVAGLSLALASLLLDRRDELTTLRALGCSRDELARLGLLEGVALALWSVTGGLILGGALGWLLIHVINKQSFGWTLGFAIPWLDLALLTLAVLTAGAASSFAVGRWGSALRADQEE